MPGKLTNNMLAQLQMGLVRDYQDLKADRKTYEQICIELRNRIEYDLFFNDSSSIYRLEPLETQKVYTVLNTFLNAAQPDTLDEESYRPPLAYQPIIKVEVFENYLGRHHSCYCPTDSLLFDWLLIDAFFAHHHHGSYVSPGIGYSGSHNHGYSSSGGGNDEKKAELWAVLALIALILIGVVLTTLALVYLFRTFADSMERLWHNEGIRQALVSMLSVAAFATASGVLSYLYLTAPLTALFFAAGITNPIGLLVVSIICLSLIGAALGTALINVAQTKAIQHYNPNALDPRDAHRYTIDEEAIIEAGLDPIKITSAIATLRLQLGKDGANNWWFYRDRKDQEIVETIRKLRRGELSSLDIEIDNNNTLHFDFRPFQAPPVVYVHSYNPMPSAPYGATMADQPPSYYPPHNIDPYSHSHTGNVPMGSPYGGQPPQYPYGGQPTQYPYGGQPSQHPYPEQPAQYQDPSHPYYGPGYQ